MPIFKRSDLHRGEKITTLVANWQGSEVTKKCTTLETELSIFSSSFKVYDNCDDADNAVRYAQCGLRLQTGISKGEKKLIVEKVYTFS